MFHLIAPSVFRPWPGGDLELPRLPALELLLARAQRIEDAGSYAETLFDLFRIPAEARATAPFCWLGVSGMPAPGWVMHADPVHFRADRDRLLLFTLPEADLSSAESGQFVEAFSRHFAEDGVRLHALSAQQWFLTTEQAPQVEFTSLEEASGRALEESMPRGRDAGQWRRMMNEAQMLFFSLPVNQQREGRGALPVNGLWFSGLGRDRTPAGVAPEVVAGQAECLLQGLLKGAAERDPDHRVLLFPQAKKAVAQQDPAAFLLALRELDGLIGSLLEEEREFRLHGCDGRALHWRKGMKWRLWRRRKPLAFGMGSM